MAKKGQEERHRSIVDKKKGMKNLKNKYSPTPGIEPGSPNREIGILTTRLCEEFLICVWIEIN